MATLSASDPGSLKDVGADLQQLRNDLDELLDHTGVVARARLDNVATQIRARPASAILIALGAGYLLGRIMG